MIVNRFTRACKHNNFLHSFPQLVNSFIYAVQTHYNGYNVHFKRCESAPNQAWHSEKFESQILQSEQTFNRTW